MFSLFMQFLLAPAFSLQEELSPYHSIVIFQSSVYNSPIKTHVSLSLCLEQKLLLWIDQFLYLKVPSKVLFKHVHILLTSFHFLKTVQATL
jgi:hypothetical protein